MLREWEWSWEGKDNKCRFGFAVRQILWVYCYITQRRHWGNNSNLTSVPWVSFAPPFLVQTGTDKKLRGSAAARGRSSPESVALVRAGPAPLFPTQLHKSPQKMFLNPPPPPPGDLSDPAVTKAIFLLTAPEPKLYPQDGTSGVQRRVLASLSSLQLGQ